MRLVAKILFVLSLFVIVGIAAVVFAGSPSGNNYFQLLLPVGLETGGDRTGDGGTGNPNDYNYFYVGQAFTTEIQIASQHTNSANIWVDYSTSTFTAGSLTTGTYFPTWSNQIISGGRIKSTGFRVSGYSSGVGTFGTMQFTVLRPTAASYGTGSAAMLSINVGTIGATTESNISYLGTDILDSKEDFMVNAWADTVSPFTTNPNPGNGASGVAVDGNYTFDLRDSKNGDGDNSGYGTGVNTTMGAGAGIITINSVSYPASAVSFSCDPNSFKYGCYLYNTTVNPSSPSGIPGDQRNWNYNTAYTVDIYGFLDYASAAQDQLGDPNGPNTSTLKTFTFTTEPDTVKPRLDAVAPARASTVNPPSTNISIDVIDKKYYPGNISGTGVSSTSCRFTVSSPSTASTTYQQGSGTVIVTAIDYGYRFTINPAADFAQNETVTVNAHDCADLVGNIMNTDIYTFSITDSGAPYVDNKVPTDDEGINKHDNITFNIKDDGSNGAVDLAHTIIYVNGVYYTNSGGAGAVTTNGTRITFASSLNFNGGNYSGDTTARTGSPGNYHFVIDPQNDFATGEAVPVIIYTQDLASPTPNIMERVVYVPVVHGATCANGQTYCGTDTVWDAGLGKCTGVSTTAGSAYCGSNTTWNSGLNKCVGSGGGSGGGSCNGGGGSTVLTINPSNVTALQIDETSILMTWYSSQPGTGRVVYGANSPKDYGKAPNYNYSNSTLEKNDSSTYHSVVISGLRPGVVYYLRPVSKINGTEISGNEITMVTKFAQTDCNTCPIKEVTVCPEKPAAPITPAKPSAPIRQTKVKKPLLDLLKILNIKRIGGGIMINGTANPSSKLKLIIY